MKCSACGRFMREPAAVVGRAAFGPKCAVKAGAVLVKPKRVRIVESVRAVRDERTADMFAEAA